MKKKMIVIAFVVAVCSAVAALVISKRRSCGSLDLDTREFDDCLDDLEDFKIHEVETDE